MIAPNTVARLLEENPDITKFATNLLSGIKFNAQHAHAELEEVVSVLDKHKQNYRLVFGTLLGLYRDAALIGHDKDIDIAVDYDDVDALYDALAELNILGYKCVRLEDRLISIAKSSCYIDFYLFKSTGGDQMVCAHYTLQARDFTSDTVLECQGNTYLTVEDPEYFCLKFYGPCWKRPMKGFRAKPHKLL